jgi:hypothetical protein
MTPEREPKGDGSSRRAFVTDVGRIASAVALTVCMRPRTSQALAVVSGESMPSAGDWDLAWLDRLATATDRAVFDWPSLGDPADPIVLQIAERYLDNCEAAYGAKRYEARVVLNIRTQAVPLALTDAAWHRRALGIEYSVKDPATGQPAVRNPVWRRAPGASTASTGSSPSAAPMSPTLEELVQRGSIVLVCDFALGHLAKRLGATAGQEADVVHRELRGSLVPGAVAVPSGIFGLARAQNAGCAYVRM